MQKNDLVRIAKKLDKRMEHFPVDKSAIIVEVNGNKYRIFIKGHGEVAWYREEQLTLVEKDRPDLLKIWIKHRKKQDRIDSDLKHIFANGKEMIKDAPGKSIEALAKCLDFEDLWGEEGKGATYYKNSLAVLMIASPFLDTSDLKGFLKFCEAKPSLEKMKNSEKVRNIMKKGEINEYV